MSGGEMQSRRLADALDDYLLAKSKAGQSGNYRRNAERVLEEWIDWLASEQSTYTFGGVTVDDCEQYALHLRERLADPDDPLSKASSAAKYYDYVSAYLGWAVERQYLGANPARHDRAREALPDTAERETHTQQWWTPDQRQAIVEHVTGRAREAVDERGLEATTELRDRALIVAIAYSGARGGELVADPHDDRRDGLRWGDVDLDNGTMVVLGKGSQQYVDASLPPQAVTALDRYRQAVAPPADEWPVFPTEHRPTLARTAREALREATDLDDDGIDGRLDETSATAVLRDLEHPPPALTTDGLRSILMRLSAAADIPDIDTKAGEYLEPHGGRHGAGDTLVREVGWEAAQDLLRHKSPETTMDTYAHIDASETAAQAGRAFARTDGTATGNPEDGTDPGDTDANDE